jgi:hypothetical protein
MNRLWQFFGSLFGINFTPDNHITPVMRLGRYHRVKGPGIFWIIPIFDQILPPVKTSLYVGDYTFREVLSKDNIPFQISLTVLFAFNPTAALKDAAAQLVRGRDSLLQIIVKDYTNQGLRRLEDLNSWLAMSAIERNLTRLLTVEMRPLGIAPLKNDGLLIKEVSAPDKLKRAILNARRLEEVLRALAAFPVPNSLTEQAIRAAFMTNLEDFENNPMLILSSLSSAETAQLPQILETHKLTMRNGQNGHR